MLELAVARARRLETAAKVALSSMLSTARANLSVGPPYDLGVYRNGTLALDEHRIEDDSPYLRALSDVWIEHLVDAIHDLPPLPPDVFG